MIPLAIAALIFISVGIVRAQVVGQHRSRNVKLQSATEYGRGRGHDVWAWKNSQTHYALVTLIRGLSIINTNFTETPTEVVHINRSSGDLYAVDAETLSDVGGTSYFFRKNLNPGSHWSHGIFSV